MGWNAKMKAKELLSFKVYPYALNVVLDIQNKVIFMMKPVLLLYVLKLCMFNSTSFSNATSNLAHFDW